MPSFHDLLNKDFGRFFRTRTRPPCRTLWVSMATLRSPAATNPRHPKVILLQVHPCQKMPKTIQWNMPSSSSTVWMTRSLLAWKKSTKQVSLNFQRSKGSLSNLFSGKMSHSDLDTRALEALKEFPPDGAVGVLNQFIDSDLTHVSNKSAFLCGVMKTYRLKRSGQAGANGTSNGSSAGSASASTNGGHKGPDEEKIKEILNRTGYKLDVTTGQRKYGGPPPNWEGDTPSTGCEVRLSAAQKPQKNTQ